MIFSLGKNQRFKLPPRLDQEDNRALALSRPLYPLNEGAHELLREHIERATRALELNPNDARAMVLGALVYQKLGDKETGIAWLRRAQAANPDSSNVFYNSACFHSLAGDVEVAFDFLEKAADLGARNKRMWESDKDFETIKDHQRFKALLERI